MSFASVDTGTGGTGLQGPWVTFHLRPDPRKNKAAAGTYSIRRKPDRDVAAEVSQFTGFDTAVMIDGDTLKTGWVKRILDEIPVRVWNATVGLMEEPPTNEKNAFGKSAWVQNFAIRGAWKIPGGDFEAFTWECSGAIEWNSFTRLLNGPIKAQARANEGKCAVIKVASIDWIKTAGGELPAPTFELIKWAPRPACLVTKTGYDADLPEAQIEGATLSRPLSQRAAPSRPPERPSQRAISQASAAQAPAPFIDDEIPF